MVMLHLLNLKP